MILNDVWRFLYRPLKVGRYILSRLSADWPTRPSMSLPARRAMVSGEKGDIPFAIRSELMKFLQSA